MSKSASSTKSKTIEDYVNPPAIVTDFLNNDAFWERLKVTAQIPLKMLTQAYPPVILVGKDEIVSGVNEANYNGAQIDENRIRRFNELRMLGFEIDYLRRNRGTRRKVDSIDARLFDEGVKNKELRFIKTINELENSGDYNSTKARAFINDNFEYTQITADVDYEWIAETMRKQFSSPTIVTLIGPMGSGKSLIQKISAEESYVQLRAELSIPAFELLSVRDPNDPDKAKLIKVLEGEGQRIVNYYDRKQQRRQGFVRAGMYVGLGLLAYPIFHFLTNASTWEAGGSWNTGGDSLKAIGSIIFKNAEKIALTALAGVGLGAYVMMRRDRKAQRNKRPAWVAYSYPETYGGDIEKKELVGSTERVPGRPVQESIKGGSFHRTDGSSVIIEQLSELDPKGIQGLFGEVLMEGRIPVGAYRTDYHAVVHIGQNPHAAAEVIQPVLDRLNNGIRFYVKNEIDRTTRTERQFHIFVEHYRQKSGGPCFDADAVQEALTVSSLLAEDLNKLEISRRYLTVLDDAMNKAKKDGDVVHARHVRAAALRSRSTTELRLDDKLSTYYENARQSESGFDVGRVNVVSYYADAHLVQAATRDPGIRREIAERNGLGYIVNVRAQTNKVEDGQGRITVITPETWNADQNKHYRNLLGRVLDVQSVPYKNHEVIVDISDALAEDDALVSGMYVAVKSSIEDEAINQRRALLAYIDPVDGSMQGARRTNKRLLSLEATPKYAIDSVVIPNHILEHTVNKDWYKLDIQGVSDLRSIKLLNGLKEAA